MNNKRTTLVDQLVEEIKPLLGGKDPDVQGGALADLIALHMAGHHPNLREEMLTVHNNLVRELIRLNDEALGERRPPEWPALEASREPIKAPTREIGVINANNEPSGSWNVPTHFLDDIGIGPTDRGIIWSVRTPYFKEATVGDWAFVNVEHKQIDDPSLRLINCPELGLTLVRPVGEQLLAPNGKLYEVTEAHRQRILGKVVAVINKVRNERSQIT